MKNIKHIFFDLDHTLWNFEKNSALTFKFLLDKYNITIDLQKFLKVYMPINFSLWNLYRDDKITKEYLRHNRLKSTFEKLNIKIDSGLIDKISNDYVKHLPDNNFLLPNAISVLDYLFQKYTLHIITNGFTEVQNTKISNSNLNKYFTCIIDSETVGVKKPHSKIFNYAYNISKAAYKNECLMIGDNYQADVMGALNNGFKAIHLNSNNESYHENSLIISDLISLKEIL
ncbi:YjjG family noncanonical pyrimidine nucleotidase [Flavobacteriaceae bacterium]|nr:YjjG family noncanonical pyrimidine nucleotidase [Flavobacteriaceae bacterium]MDB4092794.1 YjjG family noncanonical pyrimidine nucleotidase [Flavobacteriaceae bacterium]MDB9853108.1 YjjG family noncanonical pyrimidine nucleotidase [Flavobacteriaceae bacterium]MDB9995224.1 YjjG family noncanonical pyrimidine nucleotidase [Flavobacteriaceae bacterium]